MCTESEGYDVMVHIEGKPADTASEPRLLSKLQFYRFRRFSADTHYAWTDGGFSVTAYHYPCLKTFVCSRRAFVARRLNRRRLLESGANLLGALPPRVLR
jgi:hypothetical protein